MSIKSLAADSGQFHAVRFYKDAESLSQIVAEFLANGFATGQPGIVIATPEHLNHIIQALLTKSVDVQTVQERGDLILLDAEETLSAFMVDGMPDSTRFRSAIVPALEKACKGRRNCVVRAYGEMVDVLWKADRTAAATRLEMLWNDLARTQSFSLLCGYAMGNFYKDAAVEDICSHHSHVVSEEGIATLMN